MAMTLAITTLDFWSWSRLRVDQISVVATFSGVVARSTTLAGVVRPGTGRRHRGEELGVGGVLDLAAPNVVAWAWKAFLCSVCWRRVSVAKTPIVASSAPYVHQHASVAARPRRLLEAGPYFKL